MQNLNEEFAGINGESYLLK